MISGEEARRCGGYEAAMEVRRACARLTEIFGDQYDDPPSPLFHTVNGELGLFVWDGSGYQFECYVVDDVGDGKGETG